YGQLGSPQLAATRTNTSFVPVQVGGETNWRNLVVGSLANAAIRRDGTLWTWGDGSHGPRVTSGLAANNFTPIQLGTDTNWIAVASGYYHFLALQSDGSLWSWGRNGHMIGGIPAQDPSQPRRFGLGTNWVAITDGAYGNFARQRDGSWLQLGRLPFKAEPVSIPGQWWQLAQGSGFSLSVDQDGSLWHWGALFAEKKRPGWFKSALGQALKAIGRPNDFGQPFTPHRPQPEQIF